MSAEWLEPIQAGDAVWVGTYYRTIVEVQGELEDGRLRVLAKDPRTEELCPMALRHTPPEPKRRRDGPKREAVERPKLTPELRQQIADGIRCKRGHDKTKPLPNGKPGFYINKSGTEVCRWCKAEDVERWKERHGKR